MLKDLAAKTCFSKGFGIVIIDTFERFEKNACALIALTGFGLFIET